MDDMAFDQPWKKKNQEMLKRKTHFLNTYTLVDPFMV
jgi:hypothetical protein